nr:reverse transcriptase domain-containing protein [Tanacetum cinerariifolium]
MTIPVEKQNHAKFCEFHGEVRHNTDECMHLKKQIEEMLKAGKLSHLIKELTQNNGKEKPKATKKGETSGKEKLLAILMVQPWERVARQKITQSFSPKPEILFPPLGEDEGTECLMIIEAEIGGHCIHRIYVDGGPVNSSQNAKTPGGRGIITLRSSRLVPLECVMVSGPEKNHSATKPIMKERVKVEINPEYSEQTVMIGSTLTKEGRNKLCNLLQRNFGYFCLEACAYDRCPKTHRRTLLERTGGMFSGYAKEKRISKNLEVYVDDLVIKSHMEDEIVRDIEETFKTLREINMKLNLKKCTFGVEKGMFLGYKVNTKGLKTTEAEEAFKQMKQLIAELPMLTAPMEKEESIFYLATAEETVSAVLMTEREAKQMPIYFVSRALRGLKLNYTSMENLVLALVHTRKRLKRYFQAHSIIVVINQPIQHVLSRPKVARRLQKWSIELGEYVIHYRPRVSVKGQILADFIVERPEEDSSDTLMEAEEEPPKPWILFTDGSSCTNGSGAGLILTNPKGVEFTYAIRFRFDAINNEAEYEALILGLRIAEQMAIKNLQANVDSLLVANQVNETYVAKEVDMSRYLEKKVLVEELKEKSISEVEILAVVEEEGDTWMTPIFKYLTDGTLPTEIKKARAVRRKSWRFAIINVTLYKKSFLGPWLRCVGPLQANYVLREIHEGSYSMHAGPGKVKFLIVAIDYFTKWIEAKPFRDDPLKDWCEKLCIRQHFASVKHPQTNDLVERENRSLGEGIKARLDAISKNWIEELPYVLWAHRTMIKSSNGDIPFSLTYGIEAVNPAEIGMPTFKTANVDLVQNNEALEINLDLLEEKREEAAIREAKKDTGKLGPKWEGSYEVTKALGNEAYKLRDRNGKQLPRT